MNASDFVRVRRLFEAAMNLPDSQQRAFVERFCVDDPVTRDEVLGLLEADREMDSTRELLDEGGVKRSSVVEIPEQIGPYRAVSVIATGGMGMVYEGIQASPRRRVAIKTLLIGPRDERALARFEAESEVLARLEHPAIARVYTAGTYSQRIGSEERELPYYVMEYVEGASSLTDYVEKQKLSIRKRLQLFCEVCEAVDFAHAQGVIHRDLKPGNILVDKEGRPKVIDFGTARLVGEDGGATVTRSGEIVGTLNYMSPEQLSPTEEGPDARSDVYSLGCVLYELLTGRPAYSAKGRTFPEMVASVVTGTVQPPSHWDPSLSRALDLVCTKAMSKKREERYESAAEFARDLQRFLDAREVVAAAPSLARRSRLFMQRNPAVVVSILVFLISACTGVYFMSRAKTRQAALVQRLEENLNETREHELRQRGTRQNITVALTGLARGEFERGDGGGFLEALDPLQGVSGLGDGAAAANRLEAEGQAAFELRFFDRAGALFRESAAAWEELRGAEDLSVLRTRLALLKVKHASGDHEGLEEELELFEGDLLGLDRDHHQLSLGVKHLYASLALDEGRLEDAEALAWELLLDQREYLGAYHPETLKTSWLLGRVLAWQGRNSASTKYFEESREGFLGVYGPLHPDTLECQVDLGVALSVNSSCPQGRLLLKRAFEKLEVILGEEHPSTLHARVHLELMLLVQRSVGAEERVERSLLLCRANLGEDHELTRLCEEILAELPLEE
ncbi:MAG: serine/threonine-protein kinase [Planctomycetes bacterium]|nr:serine/threonine-protein kinase [Planctomycetota bacterium]